MKTSKYKVIPVKTGYIKPNEPYDVIINSAKDLLEDGDFLVISETPLAISQGRLVDESEFTPSLLATFLADIWSKYIWGYVLGPILGIKKRTIKNLRNLPPEARAHKEVVLKYYGLKHALKPASEAGIDLSNAPGNYVSLLPENPVGVVEDIARKISKNLGKEVVVSIIDTDATYELLGKLFTSLPTAINEIKSNFGFFGYVLGRFGKIKGPTPLAVSKIEDLEEIMEIAKVADDYQNQNEYSMETVYDMGKTFNLEIDGVTVEMLSSIEHMPAVIVRKRK
ncbi:MAG: coenzyme F420-0:L-glutamate ligase [Methanobacterium sp.]|uniref:coenzyme F420-0:L-glutamate ligase n=1 Tax=Methanobacterium sp. TaxID=2164 RepID=UPI003D655FDA|nr:coenzyme F420-0:L-glutamate ligase [Methanobacterium sp.]